MSSFSIAGERTRISSVIRLQKGSLQAAHPCGKLHAGTGVRRDGRWGVASFPSVQCVSSPRSLLIRKIEEVERERILLVCLESLAVVREMFLTRGENNVCLVIFTVLLRSSSSVSF